MRGRIDVLQRAGRSHGTGRPAFELYAAKLLRPLVRPETIHRSALIERLVNSDARPIVSVVAPAGYGKTTLLSQWAEGNSQGFAWVSVDEADNDPRVLFTYIAEALDAVEPVGGRVFDALASSGSSVLGSAMPRLGSAFASMTAPVVLILDDVHLLHNTECRAALSVLADHVPGGSRLVLAGRADPPLRIARLRAEGRILEIGADDLSLTCREAASLLRGAGVVLGKDEVAVLQRQTEGWAAALYLAALFLREGGEPEGAAVSFSGGDRIVADYVESELLERLSAQQRGFLTRTAVLERMCGPLCEEVLGLPGSGTTLANLAQSNVLLVPLDRRGMWYRYHHLFREMLLAELDRQEPELIPVLRRRAASWCLRNNLPEAALEYSIAGGDIDLAARLVVQLGPLTMQQGRVATIQRWLRWLDDRDGIEESLLLAVLASVAANLAGRPAEAERWADAVDCWQSQDVARPSDRGAEAWAALLRPLSCRHGTEQMRADADEAARRFAAAGIVAPAAQLLQGLARILGGDPEGADAFFEDAVSLGEFGIPEALADALAERSLLAMTRGEWARAQELAGQAGAVLRRSGTEDALVYAVQARAALHVGDISAVRRELVNAQRTRPLLTYAQPHLAVQARIELTRVYLGLGDAAGARTLMREIDEVLRHRPRLGTLVGQAEALRTQLSKQRGADVPGASALTAAELRVLPLLSTHLSFPEMGAELFLSPNTVKTQAVSIYRKLGAASRSKAVARARELGLLEG